MTDIAAIKAELRTLLEKATPIPWTLESASQEDAPNAALIVAAVNALPALMDRTDDIGERIDAIFDQVMEERRDDLIAEGAADRILARVVEARFLAATPSVEPATRCPDGMIDCNGHGYNTVSGSRMACFEAHRPSVEPGMTGSICKCGLAKSYHPRLAADHEYEPRYPSVEPAGIDEAWREAEAALPEGWFMGGLTNTSYRGDRERWLAQAYQGPERDANYRVFKHGYGDTPVEALRALAEALLGRFLPTQASDSPEKP